MGCRIKISSIVLSSFNSCLHSFTEREMKWMKRQWMNGVWKSCELMSCEWTKATKHECRRQKARRSEPFNAIHSICFNWWMHERRAKCDEINSLSSFTRRNEAVNDWSHYVKAVNSIQWNTPIQSYLIEWCDFMNFINNIITVRRCSH